MPTLGTNTSPPPRMRTQCKFHPHCICQRHGPRAPNQEGRLLCGDVIGLELPTNLLVMDGLAGGGERGLFLPFHETQSLSFCCFLFIWKHILGDDEVCFFGSSVFSSIWLIVKWCIFLLLHPCLVSFWVSSSILTFSVSWL